MSDDLESNQNNNDEEYAEVTADQMRRITQAHEEILIKKEVKKIFEYMRGNAEQGMYQVTLFIRISECTVRYFESLGYDIECCYDKSGLMHSIKISWEEEKLFKTKEEKPEFEDDEIGAIAQEYGYVLKHLRDCTIGEILNICYDHLDYPDLKCNECEIANIDRICDLRKLTEKDLATIVRVSVPKINKEKTDG